MSPIAAHASEAVTALRQVRDDLTAMLARVEAAIQSAESVAESVATLETGAPDSTERARMRTFGDKGKAVCAVAHVHNVPLRSILGPGAPPTSVASAARHAAIRMLTDMGASASDIAIILEITYEAVRRVVAARKKAT